MARSMRRYKTANARAVNLRAASSDRLVAGRRESKKPVNLRDVNQPPVAKKKGVGFPRSL
jgi:hypothetical protein